MSDAYFWICLLLLGASTIVARGSFIVLSGKYELPEPLKEALRHVGPAVYAAMVLPAVFTVEDGPAFTPENPQIWAALLAGAVAFKTKNILLTLVTGLGCLWGLEFLAG